MDKVLILVVMEYALRDLYYYETYIYKYQRLNPCCNGICSARGSDPIDRVEINTVLILVVMEYALRECLTTRMGKNEISLNPCCNGICSASRWQTQINGF